LSKKVKSNIEGRFCTCCKEFKDWDMFGNSAAGINKHMSICKSCKSNKAKNSKKKVTIPKKDIIKPPFVLLEDEVWVDVIGASKYQVSNLGRLKHKKRKACVASCRPNCGNGLLTISYIQDSGIRTGKTLGHLVAEHFVENPNSYKYIRYIDRDFLNNVAANIEYTECRVEHDNSVRMNDNGRTCTRCGNFLPWDNFCYSKKGIRDKHHVCSNCCALYTLDNYEMLQISSRALYQSNKEEITRKSHLNYLANREDRLEKCRVYHKERKTYLSHQRKISPTSYHLFKDKLTIEESAIESVDGYLEVKCSFCGEYFRPSYSKVMSRVAALNSDNGSDNRLYCSNECKKACPIYKVRDYPRGSKIYKDNPRSKELRGMAIDRDEDRCQICGCAVGLEVHHIVPCIENPMIANDLDNVITLCKDCHKNIHKTIPGCGYKELRECRR